VSRSGGSSERAQLPVFFLGETLVKRCALLKDRLASLWHTHCIHTHPSIPQPR